MQITAGPYLLSLGPSHATVAWVTSVPAETELEVWTEEALAPTHLETLTTVHEVHLTGLTPTTRYHYRASAGPARSPILSFHTQPAEVERFAFVAYGATAGRPEEHARLVEAMAKHEPAFVVHTGGLVGDATDAAAWRREVFEPTHDLLAARPLVPSRGPAEAGSALFSQFFPTPNGTPWRAYRCHNVEVVSLDVGVPFAAGDEQYEWVARMLAHGRAHWKVVVCARPLLSAGPSGGDPALRRALLPLLLRAGADLVLCGGDAIYERTHPIGCGEAREDNAIVQFLTGGGAPPATARPGPWTAFAAARPHYLLVEVKGEELTVTAKGLGGEEIDTASLLKLGTYRKRKGALAAEALEGLLAFLPPEGFDLGECADQPVTKEFTVPVENPYDTPIAGELAWPAAGQAWSFEPEGLQLLVPPLGFQQVTFQVTARPSNLDPFPAPVFVAGEQTLKAEHSPFRLRREAGRE